MRLQSGEAGIAPPPPGPASTAAKAAAPASTAAPPKPSAPVRGEALTLLSMLQQEGRLIDFLKEPITSFSDAQVGAAVREVHRGCGDTLERFFAIRPVRSESEGSTLTVPASNDGSEIRLTGNVTGKPPYTGRLAHAGWQATKVELPQWTGPAASAKVVAPAEVEVG